MKVPFLSLPFFALEGVLWVTFGEGPILDAFFGPPFLAIQGQQPLIIHINQTSTTEKLINQRNI